ncbi:hypothetical protein A9Q96_04760 [Rhodobacterales bacterium 52_120_T64]|nr:hypothetical protein A9Q96_04760 [Rhodobacterales bacterium 52_120_T64]
MTELTETQGRILNAASWRAGNLAMPLPKGLHGAVAKKVVGMMVERGLLEEVEANTKKHEPLWCETGDGQGTTLVATGAGLAAIGVDPVVVQAIAKLRNGPREIAAGTDEAKSAKKRDGTKQTQLIALVEAPTGASLEEIVAATGWQTHTVRGAISGTLKKKLGLAVISEKVEGRGRVYKIAN